MMGEVGLHGMAAQGPVRGLFFIDVIPLTFRSRKLEAKLSSFLLRKTEGAELQTCVDHAINASVARESSGRSIEV